MRAFHDSRNSLYRTPYGAVELGASVELALDIWDAPGAAVTLRTWVDGEGEGLLPMEPVKLQEDAGGDSPDIPTRYRITLAPKAEGIVWYQFIITDAAGRAQRYGALDGRFGGTGQLHDWEPPSFQLTVFAQDTEPAVQEPLMETAARFLCEEVTAHDLVEAVETLREGCPEPAFRRMLAQQMEYSSTLLLYRLAKQEVAQGVPFFHHMAGHLDAGQSGLVKGRLWNLSLIQKLLPDVQPAYGQDDGASRMETAFPWGDEDPDCRAILENADDVRRTLPTFWGSGFQCFAVNDDVFGFWRLAADGTASCTLINRSLSNAYDVAVPFAGEAVSEVVSGYGLPAVKADELGDAPIAPAAEGAAANPAGAGRYASAHLYQLGSSILYFHPARRLQKPLDDGVGILAHITSLPREPKGKVEMPLGTLGAPAKRFVDWLVQAGVRYWQVLPANPTDEHGSPYAGISAFAGNIRLLEGDAKELAAKVKDTEEYRAFCKRESDWLEPYAAFMAIRQKQRSKKVWQEWPKKYRKFDAALIESDPALGEYAEQWRRTQFVFEQQWRELRAYANERGIQIVGDMPIYVSADSSDVWANPGIFQLDADGMPATVAGCPPDQFATEGQIWGNPVYDWDALKADGHAWWLRRLERAFDLYDVVRLDHFIGFCRYFCIPAGEKAAKGEYHAGPGFGFFQAAQEKFGPLPIIAEDLGAITPAVRSLVAACGFPGMDIVQFVDGNDPLGGYQPRPEKVAYTGTHDNQTLVGYAQTRYPDLDARETARDLALKVAMCAAPVAVFPLQDVMMLDDDARMNTPGTTEGNWTWQAKQEDLEPALSFTRQLVEQHRTRG